MTQEDDSGFVKPAGPGFAVPKVVPKVVPRVLPKVPDVDTGTVSSVAGTDTATAGTDTASKATAGTDTDSAGTDSASVAHKTASKGTVPAADQQPRVPAGDVQPRVPAADLQPPVLNYTEPKWSGAAAYPYTLEVLKGGKIIDEVDISETAVQTVGRLPSCDVPCLHPSISRYHAVFQHRTSTDDAAQSGGVFLYDLGSSYGTVVNKVKLKPRTYYMLKTGYVVKFGASTRLYIVKGPPSEAFEDEEDMVPVPAKTVEQAANMNTKLGIMAAEDAEKFLALVEQREQEVDTVGDVEEGGVSWGFREDAKDDEDGELKLDVHMMAKPAEFKDPKKTLRGYFEREGVELEYVVTESGQGKNHMYTCKVELPLDTPAPVFAEGTSCGKKRDAVLACAVHGCRLLDAYGVLRSSRRYEDIETRSEHLQKNDFYDSDEDTFTDRTGEIEQKRKRRMLRAGVEERKVTTSRTHEMLTAQLVEMNKEIDGLECKIRENKAAKAALEASHEDELDAYMATVNENTVDSGALREAKKRMFDLKQERVRVERMCELSKPIALPQVKKLPSLPNNICTGKVGRTAMPAAQISKSIPTVSVNKPNKKIKIELSKAKPVYSVEKPPEQITVATAESSNPDTESESSTTQLPTSDKCDDKQSDKSPEVPVEEPEESITEFGREQAVPMGEASKEHTEISQAPTQESNKPRQARKRKKEGALRAATLTDSVTWDTEHDPDFVNWQPPSGQTGDGKTKLNAKYGY